jgi:hypothetical protein
MNRETSRKSNIITKDQKNKVFATKKRNESFDNRRDKDDDEDKNKNDASIAIVLIIQQKIADTFIQKKSIINFESNTSSKNRAK